MKRIEVNLLPAEYRVRSVSFKLRREIVWPIIGAGVLFFGISILNINLEASIRRIDRQIVAKKDIIKEKEHVRKEIQKLRDEKQIYLKKISALQLIDVNRERWVRLQEIIAQSLPEQTWLSALREADSLDYDAVVIQGCTYSFPEVGQLMSSLRTFDEIINVDLSVIEESTIDDDIFEFHVVCQLTRDIREEVGENVGND